MSRLLALAVLVAMGHSAAAQEDEAEKLFRGMEQKVRAAKTLRVRFDLSVTDALGKKWTMKGVLVLGEGDRYRAEGEGKVFGEAVQFTEVSDGTHTAYRDANDPKRAGTEKVPKGAGAYFRGALLREGFLLSSLNMKERRDWAPDAIKLSGFKFAGEERIGARNTRAIRYAITVKGAADPLPATVWLDAESHLPVRIALTGGKSDIRDVTETYSEFSIDAKVDAKTFELPK